MELLFLSREHQSPIAVFTFVGLKEMFPLITDKDIPEKLEFL
jgi:hypothetical protein